MGDVCAGFLKLEVGLTTRTAMNLTRTHVCPPSAAPSGTVLSTALSYRGVPEAVAKVATVGREGMALMRSRCCPGQGKVSLLLACKGLMGGRVESKVK